jgi:hypothetical protein
VFEWLSPDLNIVSSDYPRSLNEFEKPIEVGIFYTLQDMDHLDEEKMAIFRWDENETIWEELPTTVDTNINQAVAQTTDVGNFMLQAPLRCSEDVSEPDDHYDAASKIIPDGAQAERIFDIEQDEDWFKFGANAGYLYQLEVESIIEGMKTKLDIYDKDGVTLLASANYENDPNVTQIMWNAPNNGLYFVRITQSGTSMYGCESKYKLELKTVGSVFFMPLIQH